ncbi:MAG: hypothetical protein ACOYK8_06995 [Alphaproteobacteria bacterium]
MTKAEQSQNDPDREIDGLSCGYLMGRYGFFPQSDLPKRKVEEIFNINYLSEVGNRCWAIVCVTLIAHGGYPNIAERLKKRIQDAIFFGYRPSSKIVSQEQANEIWRNMETEYWNNAQVAQRWLIEAGHEKLTPLPLYWQANDGLDARLFKWLHVKAPPRDDHANVHSGQAARKTAYSRGF